MIKRFIVVMIAVLFTFSLVAPVMAQEVEDEVVVDNALANIFDEGDVLRLKMKDVCFGIEGKKVNLKLRKKTTATFEEDGNAVITSKDNEKIGSLNLDVKGSLVSGSKEITLKGKGRARGNDYYCIGSMFGKVKKAQTKDGHSKTLKGFDCECCFPLSSQIVKNYLKNQAEQNEKQAAFDKCQEEFDACIDTNNCCSENSEQEICSNPSDFVKVVDENEEESSNCYVKHKQCSDDVVERFSKEDTCGIAKTDAETKAKVELVACYNSLVKTEDQLSDTEENLEDSVEFIEEIVEIAPNEPCGEDAPDNISACYDAYNAALAQIKADYAVCSGSIEKICSDAHNGDLSSFTEDGLLCKSKWTLKYRNRFQTAVDEDSKDSE